MDASDEKADMNANAKPDTEEWSEAGELAEKMRKREVEDSYATMCAGLPERALFLLGLNNPIRKGAVKIIKSKIYDRCILILIILNCIFLAMSSSSPDFPGTTLSNVLDMSEYVFTAGFLVEMLLKVTGMGFVMAQGTYLRDGWNLMDFMVVVLGLLAFIPSFGNYTAIRTVRVLRPLRTITGVEGMRVLVVTLLRSLPMLLDVLVLCAFAFFIFGIVGVQVFAGAMRNRCGEPLAFAADGGPMAPFAFTADGQDRVCSGPLVDDYPKPTGGEGYVCRAEGTEGSWCARHENPNFNITSFDNILWAWLTIFQCISMEGWTDVMYHVQDAKSPWVWIYFVVMIIFGSFFAVNLALAVLYLYFTDTSTDEEEDDDGYDDGMMDEEGGGEGGREEGGNGPRRKTPVPVTQPRSPLRQACYRIQADMRFEHFTMALIIVNTIVMASEHHGMPDLMAKAFQYINYVLTGYFGCEMVIKLLGLGFMGYIKDRMNIFDGIVVICSFVEIAMEATVGGAGGSLSVLRSFRLLRVFKLARSWKQLNQIINTIFKSLASIAYLSLILLLFIFIFALLGMQLFGYKFQFCDYVDGAAPLCPEGELETGGCPQHRDCYLPCSEAQVGAWIPAEGAAHNDQALCRSYPQPTPEMSQAERMVALGMANATYWAYAGTVDVSRHNFDDIYWSTITIFQILTGENWNEVMYDGMRSTSHFAAFYFLLLVVVGNYIILNLFLAILLDNFGGANDEDDEYEGEGGAGEGGEPNPKGGAENGGAVDGPFKGGSKEGGDAGDGPPPTINSYMAGGGKPGADPDVSELHKSVNSGMSKEARPAQNITSKIRTDSAAPHDSGYENPENAPIFINGNSLCVLSPTNPLRLFLARMVCHKYFEYFIIVLICLSSLVLAVDSPGLDEDSTLKKVIVQVDFIFVILFALEMTLKVLVLGFAFHQNAYLRNAWNVLDFFIVVVGFINLAGNENLTALRPLRTFRALRPIRMASRAEGMKVVVNALFQSIPGIGNVALVCLLFYLIFGILGINLLKGMYYYCGDTREGFENELLVAQYILPPGESINKTWCEMGSHMITFPDTITPYNITHKWLNKRNNFDNIGASMLTLFEMATLEMWLGIMYDGVDAVGVDAQPVRDADPFMCVFFVVFIIVGSFFVMNLFVGVTIDKFNEMKEKQEGKSVFLTPEQRNWVAVQKLVAAVQPERAPERPKGLFRKGIFNIVVTEQFDGFIMSMILINIGFMSLNHVDSTDTWNNVLFAANCTFAGVFLVEAIFKIFAFGAESYFKDSWNLFDFTVVCFSIVGITLEIAANKDVPVVSLLRVFRVARIFRLIPKAKGLRTLFQTLMFSLPALVNVGSVLFLFFFIFAIMGMNLFGEIRHGEFLYVHANFESFPNALLVLFRMATGESWNGIMHDCMDNTNCVKVTPGFDIEGDQYYQMWFDKGSSFDLPSGYESVDMCTPHPAAAIIFFCVFVILCAFVMLNLVIAVILDNFQNSSQDEEAPVSKEHMMRFVELWSKMDPDASWYISASKLQYMIADLDPPLGVRGQSGSKQDIQGIIMSVDIPEHGGRIHFLETLHALAGRTAHAELPEDEEDKIHQKFIERLPSFSENQPKYTAAHYHAALYVQAAVRGFLARYQMRAKLASLDDEDEVGAEGGEGSEGGDEANAGGDLTPPLGGLAGGGGSGDEEGYAGGGGAEEGRGPPATEPDRP